MAADVVAEHLSGVVSLLGAGVLAVPVFRRLGLGSVLGYFAAGMAIGPFGLRLFADPEAILHTAELGVVLLLFVIGIEMQPSRLWKLRRHIFGLGVAQVATCGALLTGVGIAAGLAPAAAFVAGMGFVMSSTAVVAQMLNERGETSTAAGQKAISILLLEDLAIVPLLAVVAFLAAAPEAAPEGARWWRVALAGASLVGLLAAGRWLLDPFFGALAAANAREVMTAAALVVVLGAALLMEVGGFSTALGAFLAGVLLSESAFRHELEADIEPFRGVLLGVFFLAVGMSLDLGVVAREWRLVAAAVAVAMAVKAAGIGIVARLFGADGREALTRMALFAQGGEFAFVLYTAGTNAGLLDAHTHALASATVIVSMALTPVVVLALDRWLPPREPSTDGVEAAAGLHGRVLVVGFGRFAQVACQSLLARGIDVSLIELDVEMIQAAARFGFKVYYGDGRRLDVLRASGADVAEAICVCVDDRDAANRIVRLVRSEFPMAKLFVRAYDRGHAIDLIREGVDLQVRETFESAMAFGEAVLRRLGVSEEDAAAIAADVRRRDAERLALQVTSGPWAGADLLLNNRPTPTPLTRPRRAGQIHGVS